MSQTFSIPNQTTIELLLPLLNVVAAGTPVHGVALFPSIRPTTRAYEAPQFAAAIPKYVDTISYPRLLGSKAGEAKLSLGFENISDNNAAVLIAAYTNSLCGLIPIVLPSAIVAGIDDPVLAGKIQSGEHLDWYFDGPPRQSSVKAGVSTVQIDLIGDF